MEIANEKYGLVVAQSTSPRPPVSRCKETVPSAAFSSGSSVTSTKHTGLVEEGDVAAKTIFFLPTGSDIIVPASLSFSSLVNAEEEDGVVTSAVGSVSFTLEFSKGLLSAASLFVKVRLEATGGRSS